MKAVARHGIGALVLLAATAPVAAQQSVSSARNGCLAHVPEAASRSGLSPGIVLRVMMAESGGNARIVSIKGAMGCMQIMPATWRYLTARYNLGTEPFDARRNMIGGAMYLGELTARYGSTGALAAYNAGPGRYERYVSGATPLPAETIEYAARIGSSVAIDPAPISRPRWEEAALFLARPVAPDRADNSPHIDSGVKRTAPDRLFPLARLRQAEDESAAAR
jgi:soluble lytic murein transglycosylase-like protein